MTDDQSSHAASLEGSPRALAKALEIPCTLIIRPGKRMKRWTLIAGAFLAGAALATGLFVGLRPHAATVVRRVTIAQAPSPPISTATLLAEQARIRKAKQAAAKTSRARERHARQTKRAAAKAARAVRRRARKATHAAKRTTKRKRTRSSTPKQRAGSSAPEAEPKRQAAREAGEESPGGERLERESLEREARGEEGREERREAGGAQP
jgi:hypothetical protein